jgi:hypothetical protein
VQSNYLPPIFTNEKPETRSQIPEARNQIPDTRNQKPETRSEKPEARYEIFADICGPRLKLSMVKNWRRGEGVSIITLP